MYVAYRCVGSSEASCASSAPLRLLWRISPGHRKGCHSERGAATHRGRERECHGHSHGIGGGFCCYRRPGRLDGRRSAGRRRSPCVRNRNGRSRRRCRRRPGCCFAPPRCCAFDGVWGRGLHLRAACCSGPPPGRRPCRPPPAWGLRMPPAMMKTAMTAPGNSRGRGHKLWILARACSSAHLERLFFFEFTAHTDTRTAVSTPPR